MSTITAAYTAQMVHRYLYFTNCRRICFARLNTFGCSVWLLVFFFVIKHNRRS